MKPTTTASNPMAIPSADQNIPVADKISIPRNRFSPKSNKVHLDTKDTILRHWMNSASDVTLRISLVGKAASRA